MESFKATSRAQTPLGLQVNNSLPIVCNLLRPAGREVLDWWVWEHLKTVKILENLKKS